MSKKVDKREIARRVADAVKSMQEDESFRSREFRIGPLEHSAEAINAALRDMLYNEYRGIEVHPFHTTTGSSALRLVFTDAKAEAFNIVITKARR